MIPIWRACAVQRTVLPSAASFLAFPTASTATRVSLQIPGAWPFIPVRPLTSISIRCSTGLRGPLPSFLPQQPPKDQIRRLASLRRPSRRSSDAPFVKLPPEPASVNASKPNPDISNNVAVKPTTADPKDNALSVESSDEMKIGSEEWLNYYRERAKVSDRDEPPEMTAVRRLAPSFAFLLVTLAGCTYYALTYTHPAPKDRMFPSVPMAIATISGIIAVNFGVFLAWRIPPLWRILNTHFVQCPGDPRVFSLLGNVFSHHTFWHFAANMAGLFFIGTTLCEQIGRGNFLALYLSSGAIASFASLCLNVATRKFHIYGLGASGAVFGVLGGYAVVNPDTQLYFILLPIFTMKAATIATTMGVWEFCSLLFGWSMWMDHAAHLGGLLAGAGLAALLKEEARRRRERAIKRQLSKL